MDNTTSFSLEKLGISALNEMQQSMLHASKEQSELILHAPTGSGKTVAFLISALEKLSKDQIGIGRI